MQSRFVDIWLSLIWSRIDFRLDIDLGVWFIERQACRWIWMKQLLNLHPQPCLSFLFAVILLTLLKKFTIRIIYFMFCFICNTLIKISTSSPGISRFKFKLSNKYLFIYLFVVWFVGSWEKTKKMKTNWSIDRKRSVRARFPTRN